MLKKWLDSKLPLLPLVSYQFYSNSPVLAVNGHQNPPKILMGWEGSDSRNVQSISIKDSCTSFKFYTGKCFSKWDYPFES